MCRYQVALPPLHMIYNSSKLGGSQEPPPTGASVLRSAPQQQGRGDPPLPCSSVALAVGPYPAPGGPALGALAPPSLVPLREQLCLTNSVPPPGSRLPLVG